MPNDVRNFEAWWDIEGFRQWYDGDRKAAMKVAYAAGFEALAVLVRDVLMPADQPYYGRAFVLPDGQILTRTAQDLREAGGDSSEGHGRVGLGSRGHMGCAP